MTAKTYSIGPGASKDVARKNRGMASVAAMIGASAIRSPVAVDPGHVAPPAEPTKYKCLQCARKIPEKRDEFVTLHDTDGYFCSKQCAALHGIRVASLKTS